MRKFTTMIALGGFTVAAAAGLAIGTPALADPPSGTTPAVTDIVGVGADTTAAVVDQFSTDYNKTVTSPKLYSWDATNPTTGAVGDAITEKAGCSSRVRPNGGLAGLTEFEANLRPAGDSTDYCVDYARTSAARATTDPASVVFIEFAIDAVTWSANATTNAPVSLTTKQLQAIYSCDASILGTGKTGAVTWDEVGGTGTDAVFPVIPPSTAATRKFFLASIGVTTLGSCVAGQDNSVEQNEGTNPIFSGANAADIVFPYSVANYLAQTQYKHGTGDEGTLKLHSVNGLAPTAGKAPKLKINTKFPFTRKVYNVVRNASTTGGQAVPTYLQPIFGNGASGKSATGWVCANKTAQKDVLNYGFAKDATCGKLS